MQPSLILLFALILCLAAIGWRTGIRSRSSRDPRATALFVVMGFILAPVLAWVLWSQAGAKARLSATGVEPLPSLTHASGVAFGRGATPTWVFAKAEGTSLDFYADSAHRPGWAIEARSASTLVLSNMARRATMTIVLATDGGEVAYLLR